MIICRLLGCAASVLMSGPPMGACIFFVIITHVGASSISLAPTFFKSQNVLIPLPLLLRKRSRSRRLFACKRAHDGFGSLPTFCGDAGRLHLFRSTLPERLSKEVDCCNEQSTSFVLYGILITWYTHNKGTR